MALHSEGVSGHELAEALPKRKSIALPGRLAPHQIESSFLATVPNGEERLRRWFLSDRWSRKTWCLSIRCGTDTVVSLDALLGLAPDSGCDYREGD